MHTMTSMEVQALKVGDEVAFGHFDIDSIHMARVADINRWGHVILNNGRVFDKHGRDKQHTCRFRPSACLIAADSVRERVRERLASREMQRKCNAAAREIENILQGCRNGYGELCEVDTNTKAKLIELINIL